MLDKWALVVAFLAFIVSVVALSVAWFQLVLQRDTAGGRGIIFTIGTPMRHVRNNRIIAAGYRIRVRLVGNDRHEVSLYLERDGWPIDDEELDSLGIPRPPKLLRRWTCQDEPIRWDFDLDPNVADKLWCVLLWVSPFGEGVRTGGFRQSLRRGIELQDMEEWHWFQFFSARRRFETWGADHGPKWFRNWAGRPRRLGEWRPYRRRELQPGQSPTTWGALPPPTRQRRSWWCF